ncbi:MAG: AAA family ATPase [Calothrix sp. CSU_2_0]|nr:AAA family ATPase [Calothrix sp. CSU_2_0]
MTFNPELCRNESEVESKLIVQFLLPELGYTPDTWHQEVAVGSIRLDFLAFAAQVVPFVLDANSPLSVVMEAKHPKQNLNNHIYRLRHYLTKLNVKYGLLTNGKEIRIYQKNENDINLIFQCSGKHVSLKINEIKNLIGKDTQQKQESKRIDTIEIKNNPNYVSKAKKECSMKTIAIYHNKGGVGKTTVSVNLAAALSNQGKKVLLVDIDSQANSTFAAGLVKFQFDEDDDLRDKNIYHLLESGDYDFIPDIVRKSEYFSNPEIDVVPSHITLIEKVDKLSRIVATQGRLIAKIKKVEFDYDFVIIDTPPSRDYYAQVALMTADYLIIPSDLKPFANQGLPTVINFVKDINEARQDRGKSPINVIGVLASKISPNSKFVQYTFPKQREVITKRYKLPLMDSVIYDRTALSESMNQVLMVGDLEYPDPKSILKYAEVKTAAQQSAQEFLELANEVLRYVGE